ncbi:ABC transporter G family member 39 [Forsythia ovata]|uniref:ABC transporter G family member 39 n=1 Tax=Forsythia ovata TaxID=205694 RepID=A0ABD1SRP0_9LAMI
MDGADHARKMMTRDLIMGCLVGNVTMRNEMKTGQIENSAKFRGVLFFGLINVMFNGMQELAITIFRLLVIFNRGTAYSALLGYTIGFAAARARFFKQLLAFIGVHQMALSLLCFIAALGRTQVVANTLGTFTLLMVFVLGGFVVAKVYDIQDWIIWGYYVSPTMYGQNAIAINEFLSDRWSTLRSLDPHLLMPV